MTEKTIKTYIANDGTEFDSYMDCMDYELELLRKGASLITLNRTKHSTDYASDFDYISVPTEKGLEYLQQLGSSYGFIMPTECGKWFYDYETDIWKSIDAEIEILKDRIRELETVFD